MRLILATAGIALLASSGSAMAADCTKGLLWPYVRHPGDCLTDAEIQAGKSGVYSGPATGQVDVSTIKPPAQLNSASANAIQCSHSWYWPFGSGDCPAAPAAAATSSIGSPSTKDNPPATQPASAPPAVKPQAAAAPTAQPVQSAPPALKPQAADAPVAAVPIRIAETNADGPVEVVPVQIAQANTAECHKGILWPFVRDDGDCPTAAEAGKGKISTLPTAASTPAAVPVSAATAPPPAQPVAAVSPSTAASCTKGTFWPFIRAAGDCPTAAERSNGSTPAVPAAASEPAAMPVPVAQPVSPAPAPVMQPVAAATPRPAQPVAAVSSSTAASCTKGTFWPFIRAAGDCPTAAERSNGSTPAVPAAASEPAPMPASVPPPAQPAPVMQPVAVASPPVAASCSKGIFWPFIRESGDCATAAENGNGKTSTAPIAASEPAAMPVPVAQPVSPAPAPVMQPVAAANPPPAATCSRGTFWPFIREAGDCPTAADKGSGKTSAVPIDASAPAANPVAVPAAATMPEQAAPAPDSGPPPAGPATCHKGLLWPFVREAGDCPTDADKGPQHSPS